uniref:BHLH domain-containing protein n=1 Tax=Anopheles epiroticus TaxID=199890 RepID=A0A182P328_9DIPT
MITDNMPTDTLFSTLAQYPFPDSREIARGAGRADFIQPSLGPLQPNLDDLMDLDLDFLTFQRLAPVPEEASDELLKAIDYNYTLGSNQLTNTGSSIQEEPETLGVSGSNQQTTSQPHQATGCIAQQQHHSAGIQYPAKIYPQSLQPSSGGTSTSIAQQLSNAIDSYITDQMIGGAGQNSSNSPASLGLTQVISTQQQQQQQQQHPLGGGGSAEELARSIKSKFGRSYPKHNYDPKYPPTPHQTMAYNMVSQPHMGQTAGNNGPYGSGGGAGFQSVIASSTATSSPSSGMLQMGTGGTGIPPSLTPGSMQLHYNHSALQNAVNPVNLSNSPAAGAGGNGNGGSGSNIRTTAQMGTVPTPSAQAGSVLLMQNMNSKLLTHSQSLPVPSLPQSKPVPSQPRSTSMPTGPNYNQMLAATQHSPPGSLHASQSGSSYKSYHGHQPQPYKIPSQTVGPGGSYASGVRAMRHSSPPHGTVLQPTTGSSGTAVGSGIGLSGSAGAPVGISNALEQSQQQLQDLQLQQQQQQQSIVSTTSGMQQQQQQQSQTKRHPPHPTKEMYRSNSLPINATFPLPPKEGDNFAMPRYHQQSSSSSQKANSKLRTRSNSMIMRQQTATGVISSAGGGGMGMGMGSSSAGVSTQHMSPTLHATSSEPMLNATNSALLAQLLTTNNASTLLNKQSHSTSSSAISTLTQQQQSQPQQPQHQQHNTMFQAMSMGSTISPSSSQLQLHQLQQQQQQHHHHHHQQQQLQSSATPGTSSGSTMRVAQSSHGSSALNFASSTGMSLSQQSLSPESAHDTDGPLSPTGLGGSTSSGGAGSKYPRSDSQRRTGHIHAEQKRRYNIKNGFDTLHSLIPQLQQNPNAKLSKAAMLQKGADYIKQLRSERASANEQMDSLRREIEQLNNSLNNLHTALPASGAPVSRQRTGRVKELYHHYVRQRTLENWKFWIFGLIFEPLLNSYNQTVSVANMDEMYRTSQLWVDQHCSLVELRPAVSNQLRQLSTTTDVLSDPPSSLQEEVLKAISNSSSSNCLVPRGSGKGGSSRGGSSTETSPHRS